MFIISTVHLCRKIGARHEWFNVIGMTGVRSKLAIGRSTYAKVDVCYFRVALLSH